MRFQAGIQIVLLVTAVVIVFTVIKPKFDSIQQTQAESVSYKNAVDNIAQYNARLQQLTNQARAISAEDLAALYRYLPEKVDTVAVGRDIYNIADKNGLLLLDVVAKDGTEVVTETEAVAPALNPGLAEGGDPMMSGDAGMFVEGQSSRNSSVLMAHTFQVEAIGTYDSMKTMLQDLEKNNYPLRVVEFSFSVDKESSDLTKYSLVLETYSLTPKGS